MVTSMRDAAAAKSDLVTLYLTVQHHFTSFWESAGDEITKDLFDK
jgi:hypothetical protein